MCTPTCSCISCTVVFGQQLAGLCHIWLELKSRADDVLEIMYMIEATTSTLSQLHAILEQDRVSHSKVFTSAGHQDIEALSLKCNIIFKAVILLVQKAADRNKESPDDQENKRYEKGLDSAEETSNLLTGEVPSLTSTKTLGLIGRVSGQWWWLENRIDHCHMQLRWVKTGLLLHQQMARLTMSSNE